MFSILRLQKIKLHHFSFCKTTFSFYVWVCFRKFQYVYLRQNILLNIFLSKYLCIYIFSVTYTFKCTWINRVAVSESVQGGSISITVSFTQLLLKIEIKCFTFLRKYYQILFGNNRNWPMSHLVYFEWYISTSQLKQSK